MTKELTKQWPGHSQVDETTACLGPFRTPKAEIYLQPIKDDLYIHWRAASAASLIEAIKLGLAVLRPQAFTLYIEFIPPEFEAELLEGGFQPYSEYIDAWIRDLDSITLTAPRIWPVRTIRPEDYYTAAAITRACTQSSRGFGGESAEWVAEWMKDPQHTALFAWDGEVPLGVVFTGTYHSTSRNTEVCWLRELAVLPEAHGRGIGRELTLAALRWGREHGARMSFLSVDCQNTPAICLYEKIGYQLVTGRGQINLIYPIY